ncbi:hypothetical protein AGOR_G00076410 [Albula goreensis]|uniref:Sex hormone-binding globulin n=1 Tax=Albula goreensis TaxID=1534307 RepID=A0A8T3DQ99_9TELE|nr:hypothetical protein AGOR_G00076410 [Albula goreensis]
MGSRVMALLLLLCVSSAWPAQAADEAGENGAKTTLTSGKRYINLGQKWGSRSPLMHTKANLTELTSIKSSFELRTLDPEGVVFYGDTQGGADWFVLGLRGGVPEMQIGKGNTLISVAGGPKLNDGTWHQVELRSEGIYVILQVDGIDVLVVGLHSKCDNCNLEGQIRLSLGGILVKELELLNPLQTEMDGCVREGNWLNLSTPWETDEELQPCFTEIQKGSYFPGTGLVLFNSSDFTTQQTEESELEVKIEGHSSAWKGTVLSLKTPQGDSILNMTAQEQTKELTVIFGTQTSTLKLGPQSLALNLSQNEIKVEFGPQQLVMLDEVTQSWPTMWNEGLILAFGGVPDESDPIYLKGCLSLIQINGQDVDLDRALYKHNTISSHGCPA